MWSLWATLIPLTDDSGVITDEESDALDWWSDWFGRSSRFLLGGLCLVFGAGFLLKL